MRDSGSQGSSLGANATLTGYEGFNYSIGLPLDASGDWRIWSGAWTTESGFTSPGLEVSGGRAAIAAHESGRYAISRELPAGVPSMFNTAGTF